MLNEDQQALLEKVEDILENKTGVLAKLARLASPASSGDRAGPGYLDNDADADARSPAQRPLAWSPVDGNTIKLRTPASRCLVEHWGLRHSRRVAACFDRVGLLTEKGADSLLAACKRYGRTQDRTIDENKFRRALRSAFDQRGKKQHATMIKLHDHTIDWVWKLIDETQKGRILYYDLHAWFIDFLSEAAVGHSSDFLQSLRESPSPNASPSSVLNKLGKETKRRSPPLLRRSPRSAERVDWNSNTNPGHRNQAGISPRSTKETPLYVDREYLERNQQDMMVGDRVRQTLWKSTSPETGAFAFDAEKKVDSMQYASMAPRGGLAPASGKSSGDGDALPDTSQYDIYSRHELAFRRRRAERIQMRMINRAQRTTIGSTAEKDLHSVRAYKRQASWSPNNNVPIFQPAAPPPPTPPAMASPPSATDAAAVTPKRTEGTLKRFTEEGTLPTPVKFNLQAAKPIRSDLVNALVVHDPSMHRRKDATVLAVADDKGKGECQNVGGENVPAEVELVVLSLIIDTITQGNAEPRPTVLPSMPSRDIMKEPLIVNRVAQSGIAHSGAETFIRPQDVQNAIHEAFALIDKDNNGEITRIEVIKSLR